jgi:hypothetical protein
MDKPQKGNKTGCVIGGVAAGCLTLIILACVGLSAASLVQGSVSRGSYSLEISNGSGDSFCSLNIRNASSSARWSGNKLGWGERLEPGDRATITGLAEGYYDVRADLCADPSAPGYLRQSIPVLGPGASATLP